MNSDDSFLDLPRGIREVALELLLSEDPADKRRIAQLDRISRARGISFEAMFTQAIAEYLQNEVEDDDEDADWWKES
jgi:anti-sigma factor RsiW